MASKETKQFKVTGQNQSHILFHWGSNLDAFLGSNNRIEVKMASTETNQFKFTGQNQRPYSVWGSNLDAFLGSKNRIEWESCDLRAGLAASTNINNARG